MSSGKAKRYKKQVKQAILENKKAVFKELIDSIKSFTFRQRLVIAFDILRAKGRRKNGNNK